MAARVLLSLLLGSACLLAFVAAVPSSEVVVAFNKAAQDDVRTAGVQNQLSSKVYAETHLAQFLALQNSSAFPDAQQAATAAYAAHTVLNQWFPWRFSKHDATLKPFLTGLTPEQAAAAAANGVAIGNQVYASRLNDGFADYKAFTPAPANGPPGAYQFAPLAPNAGNQTYSLYPQLASSKTLVIPNPKDPKFDKIGGPYPVTSPEYAKDLAEVFNIGSKDSTTRTKEQGDTAIFWADGAKHIQLCSHSSSGTVAAADTSTIVGHFYTIATSILPNGTNALDAANLYARIAAAAWDASIVGWIAKYKYLHWRPITAIRQGDGVAANAKYQNASWTPFLATPSHPEYPSGHQFSAGAAAQVLKDFFGKDDVPFTVGTEGALLPERKYTSFSQAADEVGDSRIYGGIHFRHASEAGTALGRQVAQDVQSGFAGVFGGKVPTAIATAGR